MLCTSAAVCFVFACVETCISQFDQVNPKPLLYVWALQPLAVLCCACAFHQQRLVLLRGALCTAGGLAGHEHNKHHSGTGNGSRTTGTGNGFGSDQGYGSGNGSGTGNTASNAKSHVPGTEEHR